MPAVLNAANEAAVGLFLEEQVTFSRVAELIERAMDAHTPRSMRPTLAQILDADAWARRQVKEQAHGRSA